MKKHEEVTFQTLANNEDIQIGYSDNDVVVVDSIQQFTEINTAHVAMNAVVICTNGKVQAQMNGIQMELHKNQVAIIPQNVTVTDVMVSPDFNLKAMFLTNRILQSFLREKMDIWNDMMYIHRHHIVTMDEDEIQMKLVEGSKKLENVKTQLKEYAKADIQDAILDHIRTTVSQITAVSNRLTKQSIEVKKFVESILTPEQHVARRERLMKEVEDEERWSLDDPKAGMID